MVLGKNSQVMQSFTLKNIPNLDVAVLGALEFLSSKKLPKINLPKHKRLLVVGSGNALDTGRILFQKEDAVFENESTYKERLKKVKFDLAVLISASGSKHAPIIAEHLKKSRIKTILLTNANNSEAEKHADKTIVFPKQREPYTYNASTYLSMILSKTGEKPKDILRTLRKIKIKEKIPRYDSFYFIIPDKFDSIREMFSTKFDELFGSRITGRIFTIDETKHAKTLVPNKKELFISLGVKNNLFGKTRINISISKKANYGTIMAMGYYIIGKIQAKEEDYFKKNLVKYTEKASKIFKTKISPIVE